MITGWLADDDCPDCGGPLLDTSTDDRVLVLDCPGCGYHATWTITDDRPAEPGETEDEHGGCVRPVQLRRTDLDTGQITQILVPCGHTLADTCPACAERVKALRAAQYLEGWHLDAEPSLDAEEPDDMQKWWTVLRSEAQQMRDHADQAGHDTDDLDELTAELDTEMSSAGIRGNVLPARPTRRQRSTRRRQDAPDLPRRQMSPARSARPTPARTARPGGRRCSSP